MYRISAWAVTVCTLVAFTPFFASAATSPTPRKPSTAIACTDIIRVQTVDWKTGATTYETLNKARADALTGTCEDGKIYTIVQEPQPKQCKDEGKQVQSYHIESRWQPGVNEKTNPKKPGRIEFTMISAKGDLGTKVSTECKKGQSVMDAAEADKQFVPFAKGATTEGVYKALEMQKKDPNEVKRDLSNNKAYTDQLKADFDAKENPTEAQKIELVRALEDQKILNDVAAEKGAIGAGEAAKQNRELDAALTERLKGYSDPKTWGHYYDQKPTTVQEQKTESAWESRERQKVTGFDQQQYAEDIMKQEQKNQQFKDQLLNDYNTKKEAYDECAAEMGWYDQAVSWTRFNDRASCYSEAAARNDAARELEQAECTVERGFWFSTPGEARCEDTATGSTPSDTEEGAVDTGLGIGKSPAKTEPPPEDKPPPGSRTDACAQYVRQCQSDAESNNKGKFSTACLYAAQCQNPGLQGPPGDYSSPPGNYSGNPSGGNPSNPSNSNPFGYNGLSPQDQQMLERQCFDYGNSSGCSALQRYCQQNQNQNQNSSLGGIGQFLPVITGLLSGNMSRLGNLGNVGGSGGMSAQRCRNLDKSINNSMCRQYPGTQFTNGRCECPAGGQWDGTKCPATGANSCSQYPGTVLTNGTCQCPSGQQWDGTRCGGGAAQEVQAQLACAPSTADINETPIAVSWQCINADTSTGDGFNTNGKTSGSANVKLKSEDLNEDATNVDLILICTKASNTKTAVCPLEINRPFLVAVATYSKVPRGDTATIGWISKGMKDGDDACKITSDKHPGFSQTGRNVVLTTPPIQERTTFTIKCTTKGGVTKTAQVAVDIE